MFHVKQLDEVLYFDFIVVGRKVACGILQIGIINDVSRETFIRYHESLNILINAMFFNSYQTKIKIKGRFNYL